MALLKGKGSMTGVNLIARVYDNGATKDGKTHYADVQIDARDSRGPEQTNLHLKSERTKGSDGKTVYNNGAPYSAAQMDEIKKAAGPNTEPLVNQQGEKVGTLYGVKGNVMPASRGTGLVINTKTVGPSEFKVDSKTLDNQFDSMKAASAAAAEARAASREAQAEAPEQTQEVQAETQVEEPAVG
jgi:hypothetical protein